MESSAIGPLFRRAVGGSAAAWFVGFGSWAMVGPQSFFDTVATFRPYNQHFVQDIGAFQIGLGSVLLLVALFPEAGARAVGLVGMGIGSAAHLVSHLLGADLGGRTAAGGVAASDAELLACRAAGDRGPGNPRRSAWSVNRFHQWMRQGGGRGCR